MVHYRYTEVLNDRLSTMDIYVKWIDLELDLTHTLYLKNDNKLDAANYIQAFVCQLMNHGTVYILQWLS